MNNHRLAAVVAVLSLIMAGCATDKPEKTEAWGGTVVGQLNKRAVVQKVNYQTREVTVKEDTGDVKTVVAGPLVRNFNQINPGDKVTLRYQESVTIIGMSGVEARPARAETVDVAGAPLGQKPAGVIVRTGEAIAEVVDINHKDRTVTLKGPLRTVAVQVDKPGKTFKRLKAGDKVYLRSTAALAVAVTAE